MKNPNGYGGITKLPGTRRNPWRVRKTDGWEIVREQIKQRFVTIGYYPTRHDAMIALAEYNKDPFDLHLAEITFAEVYKKWSDIHFEKVSQSNVQGYKAAYILCDTLENMRMVDIKLDRLQKVVDSSGKNTPTLKKLKILWGLMWDYCVMHEILSQEKRDMVRYVDINKAGNPNSFNRKPFSKKEIQIVWKWVDTNEYFNIILMLIYSGCRISEMLDLKKENVNLEEKWFDVVAAKTKSGIRKVPVSDRILPFFKHWMLKNDCEYLLSTPDGKHLDYYNYYGSYWKPLVDQIGIKHTPHCARHTCVSLLAAAGVDERLTKKIVGHKGQGVTETVYTHFEIDELLEAINKI